MTKPRRIVPGATWLVTRRTHQRSFLLAPNKRTNELVWYLLSVGASKFSIRVHAVLIASNHYHLLVTDLDGNLPRFAQWFDSLLVRALNALYGRRDSGFSASNKLNLQLVTDRAGAERVLGYIAANPVAFGAVRHGREWPGVRTNPRHYHKVLRFKRPTFFFPANSKLPPHAEIVIVPPPMHSDLPRGTFIRLAATAIGFAEEEARREREERGLGYVGRKASRGHARSPDVRAVEPEPLRAQPTHPVLSHDALSRKELAATLRGFQEAYALARAAWEAGRRAVEWPFGTYLMRVRHGVPVASPA